LLIAVVATACAPSRPADYDRPVSSQQPRATLTVRVSMPSQSDCEERVSLALYADKTIDLVLWEPAASICTDRVIRVRYLASQTSKTAILSMLQSITIKFEELTP